jgi:hypothetical protein
VTSASSASTRSIFARRYAALALALTIFLLRRRDA